MGAAKIGGMTGKQMKDWSNRNGTDQVQSENIKAKQTCQITFIPAITFPRLDNDWLMAAPSLSLSPVAPVESARSLFKTKTKLLFIIPTFGQQQLAFFYHQWKVTVVYDI